MRRISLSEKGATLIELLFSSIILIVATASFYRLLLAFYQNYQNQEEIAEIQQQARVAADLLSREIEAAGYDPTGSLFLPEGLPNEHKRTKAMSRVRCGRTAHPAEPILEATPVVFHVLADLNGNSVVDDSVSPLKDIDEDVRYEWVGESGIDSCGARKTPFTLYRDTGGGGGGQEVAFTIDQFELVYFDEQGRALPKRALSQNERTRVGKVVMTLRARSERRDPNKPPEERLRMRQITFEVRLRNM